jgi:mono/diheme cytochrome c family protein
LKNLVLTNRVRGKRVFHKSHRILLILLFSVLVLWAQQPKEQPPANPKGSEYKIPPVDAAKANPVKPSAESHAKGKKLYGYDCAMCHGKNGDGKGDMAADMKNMPDFTHQDALKGRTDGELFYIIVRRMKMYGTW